MLRIKNLSKTYYTKNQNVNALKDVNITLPNTGLVSIIGESGCGKTTLLNLIGMIDQPTNGEIDYNGIELNNNNADYVRSKVVTTVSQEDLFFQELNVASNIRLALEVQNNFEDESIIEEWLRKVGLDSKSTVFPRELSSGQKQRVTLSRSLARQVQILLADEPTANLDEKLN